MQLLCVEGLHLFGELLHYTVSSVITSFVYLLLISQRPKSGMSDLNTWLGLELEAVEV